MPYSENRKHIEVKTVVTEWKLEGLDQTRTSLLKVEPDQIKDNEAVSANVRSQLADDTGSSFLEGHAWLGEDSKAIGVTAYSSRVENNMESSYRVRVDVWMRADGTATIVIDGAKEIETQIVNGNTQIDVIPPTKE